MPNGMDDDVYRARIAEAEQYFTDRVCDPNWRTRWYYPDADEAMRYILSCVDADVCETKRPEPVMAQYLKVKTLAVLALFDRRWSRGT